MYRSFRGMILINEISNSSGITFSLLPALPPLIAARSGPEITRNPPRELAPPLTTTLPPNNDISGHSTRYLAVHLLEIHRE